MMMLAETWRAEPVGFEGYSFCCSIFDGYFKKQQLLYDQIQYIWTPRDEISSWNPYHQCCPPWSICPSCLFEVVC